MLASLAKIKPSGVCIFREYAEKKNFKARPRILKIYARLMTPASRMGRDRFISSEILQIKLEAINPNACFMIINTEPIIFIV